MNFALSNLVLVGSDRVDFAPLSLLMGKQLVHAVPINVKPILFMLNGVTVMSRLAMIRFCLGVEVGAGHHPRGVGAPTPQGSSKAEAFRRAPRRG